MKPLTATLFRVVFKLVTKLTHKLIHLDARLRVVEMVLHELEDHREVVGHLLKASVERSERIERRLERIEELDIIRMQAPDHEKYRFEGGEQ